jgi:hypothetical protein
MKTATAIRKEYRRVCDAMKDLEKKNGSEGKPLPHDEGLYFRLYTIQYTLEWVHSGLIKTASRKPDERRIELMGHKHYIYGPVHRTLYP